MRVLSELFPKFVKKSQSIRLDEGPFGAGVMKARMYLKPGEEPPQGAKVQTGPKGGRYYEDMGGGGQNLGTPGSHPSEAQGVGDDFSGRGAEAQGQIDDPYYEAWETEYYNNAVAAKESELGRGLTTEEQEQVVADTVEASLQDQFAEAGVPGDERQARAEEGGPELDVSGQPYSYEADVQGKVSTLDAGFEPEGGFANLGPEWQAAIQQVRRDGGLPPITVDETTGEATWSNQPTPEESAAILDDRKAEVASKVSTLNDGFEPELKWHQMDSTWKDAVQQVRRNYGLPPITVDETTGEATWNNQPTPEESAAIIEDAKNDPDHPAPLPKRPLEDYQKPTGYSPADEQARAEEVYGGGTGQAAAQGPSEADVAFKTPASDGGEFVVSHRDTTGMPGQQDKFSMSHVGPDGTVTELGSHASVSGAKAFANNRGITSSGDESQRKPTGFEGAEGVRSTGAQEPSAPVFDGQGNVHLPGYDPYSIAELDWEDAAQGGLLEQYTAETGGSMDNANRLLENTVGSLDQNYLEDVIEEQAGFMADRGSRIDPPSYDISGDGEDALSELGGFFDWLNSKSGGETTKMLKMMQTHNINNTRREPIVLANKGGNQRRNAYVRGIYKK